MSAALNTLRQVFPDFAKARRERNKIRKRYRDNLYSLDRDDVVYPVTSQDYKPEYLGNRTEKKLSYANHIMIKYGSGFPPRAYQIEKNEKEVRESMEEVISSINRYNYLSLITEVAFIVVVVLCISVAVYLAIAGIDAIMSQ